MRRLVRIIPFLFLLSGAASAACADATGPRGGCCKVCRTGKACGDTCIARDQTCNTPAGCACNG